MMFLTQITFFIRVTVFSWYRDVKRKNATQKLIKRIPLILNETRLDCVAHTVQARVS